MGTPTVERQQTLFGLGIIASYVDITAHRLPDQVTVTAGIGTVAILAVIAAATCHYQQLGWAIAARTLGGGTYLALELAGPARSGWATPNWPPPPAFCPASTTSPRSRSVRSPAL